MYGCCLSQSQPFACHHSSQGALFYAKTSHLLPRHCSFVDSLCECNIASLVIQASTIRLALSDRTPWHRNQDSAFHCLDQWHRLMNRISPAFDTPRLLSPQLSLLQICKLPKMMHCVEVTNLYKPCPNALHDFPPCLETFPPMRLPFQQITRMKRVRS